MFDNAGGEIALEDGQKLGADLGALADRSRGWSNLHATTGQDRADIRAEFVAAICEKWPNDPARSWDKWRQARTAPSRGTAAQGPFPPDRPPCARRQRASRPFPNNPLKKGVPEAPVPHPPDSDVPAWRRHAATSARSHTNSRLRGQEPEIRRIAHRLRIQRPASPWSKWTTSKVIPSKSRRHSSSRNSATESAPPETPTPTRSPGAIRRA